MKLYSHIFDKVTIDVFNDELIDARSYLVSYCGYQVIVDPHIDEDIIKYLKLDNKLSVLLTHEHYDHISGVNWIREQIPCSVYASRQCAKELENENNKTIHYPLLFIGDRDKYHYAKGLKLPYICKADIILENNETIDIPVGNWISYETPGHSPGGMSYLLDNRYLFSGDNLIGNGMELKSIGSDANALMESFGKYEKMSEDVLVFPGHGEIDFLGDYLAKVKRLY